MKSYIFRVLIASFLLFGFLGCGGGGGGTSSTLASLGGFGQKGPFYKDSNVTLCKLDEKMFCTSELLETKVNDDQGSYEFKTIPWSGLSRLTISGYYFDELTGAKSLSPVTITAIVKIKSNKKQKTNINILTDMQAKRMKGLVDNGKKLEDALYKAKKDVKQIFNISSDDFTALNLTDFSEGRASVNVELLRISAAVDNAEDPVAALEKLMSIYNEYGIEGVLNSDLYKQLMGLLKDVNITKVMDNIGIGEDEKNNVGILSNLNPFAIANIVAFGKVNSENRVRITLVGTKFTSIPLIQVNSTNNSVGIVAKTLSDDNTSVLLDMNTSTSCEDINVTFTIDKSTLKNVNKDLVTKELSYKNDSSLCLDNLADLNGSDSGITVNPKAIIALVPLKKDKVKLTLIATEFENYDNGLNYEINSTSNTLQIIDSNISDDNKSVIFTFNEEADNCTDTNLSINLNPVNLKDVNKTVKSNVIKYKLPSLLIGCTNDSNNSDEIVVFNRPPIVSIAPSSINTILVGSTLELNATATDPNANDTVTFLWRYRLVNTAEYTSAGTTSSFSHTFDTAGSYLVQVIATDNHDANSTATVEFNVVENHAPTVSISPSGDKNITVGDSITLKSNASDQDGDDLTISWKLKELGDSDFTTVANFGATGFHYTFNTVGTYLVVVEAEDGNGSKADANITVNVSGVAPITMTLDDINISVTVKGYKSEQTNFNSDILPVAQEDPSHGTVEYFKIGNETPAFKYTSTDCFVGTDSFVYKSGNDYGRVNVTITAPSSLSKAVDINKSIFNTEVISGEYLRENSSNINVSIVTQTTNGSSSLTIVGNETINYNYDPNDNFVGNDFFEYRISESINGCQYSDIGRVNIEVKAPLPSFHLFSWYDDEHGTEVWRTDGTVNGTRMVKDIWPGTQSGAYIGHTPFSLNGIYYFEANDGNHSSELWRSDGTEVGTYMVKDINPGVDDGSFPYRLSAIGNTFYFFARTGDNNGSNFIGNYGLWKSDGTEFGTLLVEDFGDDSLTSYMAPGYLQSFGNLLIFAKDDGPGNGPQWEPWISDGVNPAFKLKDIYPGVEGSDFRDCVELNGKCYSGANDYDHGEELWVTDGTTAGTYMVKDINQNSRNSGTEGSFVENLTAVGNRLFFVAFDTLKGISLWKSDGSEAGTVMVKDSFADENETNLMTRYGYRDNYSEFTDVNGTLYFVLNDGTHGRDIWKSDGSEAGTVMVKDLNGTPSELTDLNGILYFWVWDDTTPTNSGLYKTDGTEAGTVKVKEFSSDFNTGFELSGSGITKHNGKLYIELIDYGNNFTKEYWVSDGSEAGTFKLVDGRSMSEEP